MKIFLAIVILAAGVVAERSASEYESMFESFVAKYARRYADETERQHRFEAFKATVDRIDRFNADPRPRSYSVGINKFSDVSREEFLRTRTGFRASQRTFTSVSEPRHRQSAGPLPASFDWRPQGVVSYIKDQGQCGSCWSFSSTGAIEGTYAIASGQRGEKNINVCSEQNIIDCSWASPYNNTGCNGGDMREALQYVIDNKGIDSENKYPYEDYDGGNQHKCRYNLANKNANITSMVFVDQGNETDLAYATLQAPVSVAIDASQDSFQDYTFGVYYEPACRNDMNDLDHGVLVVGFGNTGGKRPEDYWIVKNSWGPEWGMEGYILMARNDNNQCGIATYATYVATA